MMKKIISFVIAAMLMVLLGTEPSYAAGKSCKVASSKGVTIKVAGGTGYAVTPKRLKKGTKVTLQPISAKSRYAKTLCYGRQKNWKAAKIANALKKPKAYKVKTTGFVYYKAMKGGKLRYIVAVKKPSAKPKPAIPAKPAPVVSDKLQAPERASVRIKLHSADPQTYASEVYDLDGTILAAEGDRTFTVKAEGNGGYAETTLTVPMGNYTIWFPRRAEELAKGQTPYFFDSQDILVDQKSEEIEFFLDPVPGLLCIELTEEDAERLVLVDGEETEAPCEMEVPAGEHTVELVEDDATVKSESVMVVPGAPTGIEL